ncbi:galactokinase [Ornithinimicrobium flavum]|uniref:galactokinase n=1 Tax=Ornithinimicrobium flavum TaxID=1288636 RepID=UPI00106F53B8|nr:galactokinase [Ornithinimicrobium flavum]
MTDQTWVAPPDDAEVVAGLGRSFADLFGGKPDGVWAAPGRVNLIGEHTDYNGGWCLPLALAHRTYAAVRHRGDGHLRVASRQMSGLGYDGPVPGVRPRDPGGWVAYLAGVVAILAERAGPDRCGVDVLVDGRVPLGAGLSSSAALSCSVAVALRDVVPGLADLGDAELVDVCVRAENAYAGAATGGMDQTVSVRAVDEHLLLLDARDGTVTPVAWTLPEHEVLVVDTRASHSLADGQYAARRATCEAAAAALGLSSLRELGPGNVQDPEVVARLVGVPHGRERVRHVVTENERVLDLVAALRERDARAVGALMTASHLSLRDDYEVSCHELDLAVDAALGAGAVGARMTGGGFGGSAIALVRRDSVDRVAVAVASAFAEAGLTAPHFLSAVPSRPAGRVR